MDFTKFELDKISLQSCYYMMNLRLCLFNTIAYLAKFPFLPLAASASPLAASASPLAASASPLAASASPLAASASPLAAFFHPSAASFHHTALLAVDHSHPGGNYCIVLYI